MPKTIFTKNDIIKAAFFILEKEGLKYITARNVAKKMGGSTAPIYASFDSMDEIKKEVINIAQKKMEIFLKKEYTDNMIVNIGAGLIIFSREEKKLFKSIFSEENNFKNYIVEDFKKYILISYQKMLENKIFEDETYKCVLERTLSYSYGLASCMMNSCNEHTDEQIIKMVCTTFQFILRGFKELKKEGLVDSVCDNIF